MKPEYHNASLALAGARCGRSRSRAPAPKGRSAPNRREKAAAGSPIAGPASRLCKAVCASVGSAAATCSAKAVASIWLASAAAAWRAVEPGSSIASASATARSMLRSWSP
ncbi:MAG: hypothetical protein DWI63_04065 [Chloroflexi bacterium]|nr:MAG: hypothetical protein DWI63_04065 [Chloroflexota bacterium]